MSDRPSEPKLKVRAPTFHQHKTGGEHASHDAQDQTEQPSKRHRAGSALRRLHRPDLKIGTKRPSIYAGSYRSNNSDGLFSQGYLHAAGTSTPRTSVSHLQLEPLLAGLGEDIESYGLHEFRDGLFDATFVRPQDFAAGCAKEPLRHKPQAQYFDQLKRFHQVVREIFTSRAGIRLFKSFLGFLICYVLCLLPSTNHWLGQYNYLIAVSAIINHPGRSVGSQIDGAVFTCLGSVIGLLWGSFAVWLSSSSSASQAGYGAVITPFFIIFTLILGWMRCMFARLYQAILASGVAFFYITLSQNYTDPATTSSILLHRIVLYLLPWTCGQALCLLICWLAFPSAGNRPLALAFHSALEAVRHSLVLPRPDSPELNRTLAFNFVNVSQATRDFALDLTFSQFSGEDSIRFRNRIQGVIRATLAFRPSSGQFQATNVNGPPKIEVDGHNSSPVENENPTAYVLASLADPTWRLVNLCQTAVDMVDYIIMSAAGFNNSFKVKSFDRKEIEGTLADLALAQQRFDEAEKSLLAEPALNSVAARHEEAVDLFVFMHPVRQAAEKVWDLLHDASLFHSQDKKWSLRLPSYPWSKAMFRMNPTIRHDRGGLTAAHYFGSKRQLEKTMEDLQQRNWTPLNRYSSKEQWEHEDLKDRENSTKAKQKDPSRAKTAFRRFLHAIWIVMHRFQDFEARFALKKTIVCTLLSLPALLPQSSLWWYENDCWWATVTIWLMMHPRVGGNLSDLVIRCSCAAIGVVWAGLAFAAGSGHPIIIGIFAVIVGVPMIYRFTLSNHPRSGIIGILAFTVVSLILYNKQGEPNIVYLSWSRGAGFVIGVVVAVMVNWIFWPFVARHELRKSLATMILHSALVYRRILAIYIYYKEGEEPTPEDVAKSEMLEGRIREGFVRVRQLMALTKHEIRLRGPFNPKPYAELIDTCEIFFDRLIDVRQSTLFFKPELMKRSENTSHNLFALRRDAAASMLMLLYVLAGALRERRPLPRFLPSAVLSRQRLLDTMDLVQEETAPFSPSTEVKSSNVKGHGWEDVYRYAFSGALTDCVEQVQELVRLTRSIVGEVGLSKPTNDEDI